MKVTFENIHNYGSITYENELVKHYYFPEMPIYYSGNFILFKRMPTVEEFISTSTTLRDFHKKNDMNHVNFKFPPNQKPLSELIKYLEKEEYDYSFNELYVIKPENFPQVSDHLDTAVGYVTEETLPIYLDLQYQFEIEFGQAFAEQKRKIHIENFENNTLQQVISFYEGKPAGTLDLIINDDKVEIDSFTVLEQYRKKGVGTRMQRFVMDEFPHHWVFLVADGEDTPREMYQKQKYKYYGFQYEVLKVYPNI